LHVFPAKTLLLFFRQVHPSVHLLTGHHYPHASR
jgi:hypothetical protein